MLPWYDNWTSMVVTYQYFTLSISSIFGYTTRWSFHFLLWIVIIKLLCVDAPKKRDILHICWLTKGTIQEGSHLSWVVPLGGLGDVVHEVELAWGRLGHLPSWRKLTKHLVFRPTHVVALLPLVVQLQRLVRLEQIHNQTFGWKNEQSDIWLEKFTIRHLVGTCTLLFLICSHSICKSMFSWTEITWWCVRNYVLSIMQKVLACKQACWKQVIVLVWACQC